jgi:RES domain-containing protein
MPLRQATGIDFPALAKVSRTPRPGVIVARLLQRFTSTSPAERGDRTLEDHSPRGGCSMPTTKPETEPRGASQVLDKALADTFPASDPPAATSFTPAAPATDEEESASAYLVMDPAMADKRLEDWRTCGQSRWVSPNVACVQLALSPALALLDALTSHGLDRAQEWTLAHVIFPASRMLRLDNPHECWRERTFRNDVRLFGDRWALEQQSLLLRVPSPLCPLEHNLLVNLLHTDLATLRLADTCPLDVDTRLLGR